MTQTTQTTTKDPAQLVPPRVDTGIALWRFLNIRDVKMFIPSLVAGLGALVSIFAGPALLLWAALPASAALAVAAVALKLTTPWYLSPRERINEWIGYVRQDDEDTETTMPGVTAVDGLDDNGYVEAEDGRFVAAIPVESRNASLLDEGEKHQLAAALSSAIDEEIRDIPFRIHAATRREDISDIIWQYRDAADRGGVPEDQQELLMDVSEWLEDADAPNWNAREWDYYVVVDADAGDVRGKENPSLWEIANPLTDTETVEDEHIKSLLSQRVETVRDAISTVTGLRGHRPTPETALDMVCRHWARDIPAEDVVDELVSGTMDIRRAVEPEDWSTESDWVQVGDEYVRTLWIAEYPEDVESMWLSHLRGVRGISLSLTINCEPVAKNEAIHELSKKIADVGSEGVDRQEDQDVSAMDVEDANDANVKFRKLLRDTSSQAWDVSTYVTVRADDEAALRTAQSELKTFENVDGAKRTALDNSTDTVREELQQSPANTVPVAPSKPQETLFRAASPLTRDVWNDEGKTDKKRRVPGAVIGSSVPFVGESICEETGLDWGRNESTGTHLRLSPFERGGSPHMLTIGRTRSGKTYSASKAALRWFAERDDRTLICVDTQKGFDGLTQLCGGEHVVVDGSQAVNPLRIEASSTDQTDPETEFRMTVEETVGFLLGLLRADDVPSPGEYAATLSQAAEETLVEAGIDPTDASTFDDGQPHLGDLVDTLVDMSDNAEEYTFSDSGMEVEDTEKEASKLLTKLRSFRENGKYASYVGEDELNIIDPDVDMAYLDLSNLSGSNDAKSAMLQLMLAQIREKIKQTEGEVIMMVDEAHMLLDNERTADWLQKATREFARFDASLWFLSQSPKDFISGTGETDARDTIRSQCGITHIFRTPGNGDNENGMSVAEALSGMGLNETQRDFVMNKATRGKDQRGYSECLIGTEDIEGWLPVYVESTPLEDHILTYERRDHGGAGTRREDFERYFQRGVEADLSEVAVEQEVTA